MQSAPKQTSVHIINIITSDVQEVMRFIRFLMRFQSTRSSLQERHSYCIIRISVNDRRLDAQSENQSYSWELEHRINMVHRKEIYSSCWNKQTRTGINMSIGRKTRCEKNTLKRKFVEFTVGISSTFCRVKRFHRIWAIRKQMPMKQQNTHKQAFTQTVPTIQTQPCDICEYGAVKCSACIRLRYCC